jgi:hypothetical protein
MLLGKLGDLKQELVNSREEAKSKATAVQVLEQKVKEKAAVVQSLEGNLDKSKTYTDNERQKLTDLLNKEKQKVSTLETVRIQIYCC